MAGRIVHRELLRLSRQIDQHPAGAKALLTASAMTLFDRRLGEVIDLGSQDCLDSLLYQFNKGQYYHPNAGPRSLSKAVREARESLQHTEEGIEVGLAAMRRLDLALHAFNELNKTPPKSRTPGRARQHQVAMKVSKNILDSPGVLRVAAKEELGRGSLLLTHPVSCLGQPTLHGAVILIIQHSDQFLKGNCLV